MNLEPINYMLKTYKISISGQVQGVGFRPYIYKLAQTFKLNGTVSNTKEGVLIYCTGFAEIIGDFYTKILQNTPPVSKIQHSSISEVESENFSDFKIITSPKSGQLNIPLTPDFAICEDCKNDIEDTENKRFNYPFTTCVNCGPRWSITETFPFERNHTSIYEFSMCDKCKNEYTNPDNRRFHSQTNTCATCGISLKLSDASGKNIKTSKEDLFPKIAKLLKEGNIIAIKNTSGYLLCCTAENKAVIQNLRTKKNRPNKPFAILFPSLDFLKNELDVTKFI